MPFENVWARPAPFGRVTAEREPEPEIENFRKPFSIRGPIGMEAANRRRDVAKVESLLGRTGALDLDLTDGVTGYFGPRVDAAVRRFQATRGLKDRTDPQAGDIDRDESEKALPDRTTITMAEKQAAPTDTADSNRETKPNEKNDRVFRLSPKERAIFNIFDNILGLLLLRGARPGRLPRGPTLQFVTPPEEPGA